MKKYFLILIALVFSIHCSNELSKQEINGRPIFGTYFYSKEDPTKGMNRFFGVFLTLFKDSTFEENNENIQCYANLPDYSGIYTIKNSVLTTIRKHMLDVYADTNQFGKRPTYDFFDIEKSEIKYLIKGDSLINLNDQSIRLYRYSKTED